MVRQVKLPDLSVQAVVDETIGEIQEKVSAHGTDDLLNTHPIIEDAVEDGLADLVVVQRLGVDTRRRGAEGGAAIAPGSILTVSDVEVDDLLVGDRTNLTVEDGLALAQLAASEASGLAGGVFRGYGSNVGTLDLHGLRAPGDLVEEPYLPARRL